MVKEYIQKATGGISACLRKFNRARSYLDSDWERSYREVEVEKSAQQREENKWSTDKVGFFPVRTKVQLKSRMVGMSVVWCGSRGRSSLGGMR